MQDSGLGGSRRGFRGSLGRSSFGRGSFGRSGLFHNHRLATAITTSTAGATAAGRSLAAGIAADGLFAVALAMTTMEQTMATTTVATAAMAAMTQAGDGGCVTTHQSKNDQGDERRERNSEKTLHFFLRSLNAQAIGCAFQVTVNMLDRSGTATEPQQPRTR
jgi:hypothetical protein